MNYSKTQMNGHASAQKQSYACSELRAGRLSCSRPSTTLTYLCFILDKGPCVPFASEQDLDRFLRYFFHTTTKYNFLYLPFNSSWTDQFALCDAAWWTRLVLTINKRMVEEMEEPGWRGSEALAVNEKEILYSFYDRMHSLVRSANWNVSQKAKLVSSVPILRFAVPPASTGAVTFFRKPKNWAGVCTVWKPCPRAHGAGRSLSSTGRIYSGRC